MTDITQPSSTPITDEGAVAPEASSIYEAQRNAAESAISDDLVRLGLVDPIPTPRAMALLAGIQALCISANQECSRQQGVLSSFDRGWFTGQLHIFDQYTEVDKSAIAQARDYLDKIPAADDRATQDAKPEQAGDCEDCPRCRGSSVKGEVRGVRCVVCSGRGYIVAPAASNVEAVSESVQFCTHCDAAMDEIDGLKVCPYGHPQSAPIEAGELPPLPKAERELIELHQPSEYTTHVCTSARYTADQMLAYGKLCRDIKLDDGDSIYRVHVEGWATKAGWVNKAEGAFEFAQRTCYRQGWNDAVTQLNMKEGQQ